MNEENKLLVAIAKCLTEKPIDEFSKAERQIGGILEANGYIRRTKTEPVRYTMTRNPKG